MQRVLILCTGNSCRSQIAEALWNELGGPEWEAFSAGSDPAGFVHPLALAVLGECGLETENLRSKSASEFRDRPMQLVVTVCDEAQQACPHWPSAERILHWPLSDPAKADGNEEEQLVAFRRVRDQLRDSISQYLKAQSDERRHSSE